jgi:hypothetical protein
MLMVRFNSGIAGRYVGNQPRADRDNPNTTRLKKVAGDAMSQLRKRADVRAIEHVAEPVGRLCACGEPVPADYSQGSWTRCFSCEAARREAMRLDGAELARQRLALRTKRKATARRT